MELTESIRAKFLTDEKKALMEKYNPYIKAVKSVYPETTDIQQANLAVLCENLTEQIGRYKATLNETTQVSNIGNYIPHALDILVGVMPNLVAEDVVSVQALDRKVGLIFFLKYVYGDKKGAIGKGDTMFGPYEINGNSSYTAEDVTDEQLVATAAAGATITASLAWTPVTPGSVVLTLEDGSAFATDNGKGVLTGAGITDGTVSYETGAVSFKSTAAVTQPIVAGYTYNMEYAPTHAPEIQLSIEETSVTARPRRLRALYSFESAYDLKKQFGMDIDSTLLDASTAEIRHEIDLEILFDLYKQAGLSTSWDSTMVVGVSWKDKKDEFYDAIVQAANAIFQKSKRVRGNFVIVGKKAEDIVETLPYFVPASDAADVAGPHLIGTLKQFKIYACPDYAEDAYLVGYKGNLWIDAGYVYAPYLPIFATDILMMDDFLGRRGFGTSYAKKMLNANYYVKGKITGTGNTGTGAITVKQA